MQLKLKQLLCFMSLIVLGLITTYHVHWTQELGGSYLAMPSSQRSRIVQGSNLQDLEVKVSLLSPDITPGNVNRSISIHFPFGKFVRSDVLKAPWVTSLKHLLKRYSGKQINIVTCDAKFQTSLLNWLISALVRAEPPLDVVVVLSFDKKLQELLESRGIPSVYVDRLTVMLVKAKMKTKNSHIWVIRNTVYRLISYWGYDIAMYDTDAIVMTNPQSVFDAHGDSDIIGSAGTYPFQLGRKWGLTFCMGVTLFRHTPRTELLWEAMSVTNTSSTDDQVRLNYALNKCSIQWIDSATSIRTKAVEGVCAADKLGALKVTILPHSVVCRQCVRGHRYFIWHSNAKKTIGSKVKLAKLQSLWFLRNDWKEIGNTKGQIINSSLGVRGANSSIPLTGISWLKAISVFGAGH